VTESNVDFIPGYSPIQQIIQKSERARLIHHDFAYLNMTRILIAGIRNLGKCPCPRCFIPKDRVHNIGTASDIHQRKTLVRTNDIHRRTHVIATRRIIYEKHFKVDSAAVESILRKESWVPATVRQNPVFTILTLTVPNHPNAFSDRLAPFGFDLFRMLLPDLMHEFELGVWRAVFIHLLRILESVDDDLLLELNKR
jgi:hypothetical protein